jgi:hypothetical protein
MMMVYVSSNWPTVDCREQSLTFQSSREAKWCTGLVFDSKLLVTHQGFWKLVAEQPEFCILLGNFHGFR